MVPCLFLFPKAADIVFGPFVRIGDIVFLTYFRSMSEVLYDFGAALTVTPDILDDMICVVF